MIEIHDQSCGNTMTWEAHARILEGEHVSDKHVEHMDTRSNIVPFQFSFRNQTNGRV